MYDLKDKKILVLGYAMTGESVAHFLVNKGAQVTINDRGEISDDPSVSALVDQGVEFVTGEHPLELLDQDFDFIVKNPGIPYSIPFIQKAQEKGIPIYTDVELCYWYSQAPIIGVTGSNGKTTTTSLIYELLKGSGDGETYLAGNIGVPTLDVCQKAQTNDQIVMELSSFQLMGTQKFKPEIAVICNIYSAHLDYHETQDNYVNAKLKILSNLDDDSCFVYKYDQDTLKEAASKSKSQSVPFTILNPDDYVRQNGAYIAGDNIYFRGEKVAPLSVIKLPGQHNQENVLAAVAVAKIKGIENSVIESIIKNFNGIPYRIQHVASIDGVEYFNDSKATNTVATITALKSFPGNVVYIGGGLDRGNDFDDLIPYLKRVKSAHLYGETKDKLKETFVEAGVNNSTTYSDLTQAIQGAIKAAVAGDTVLFSPACASWDQFENFEIRGDSFNQTLKDYQEGRKI